MDENTLCYINDYNMLSNHNNHYYNDQHNVKHQQQRFPKTTKTQRTVNTHTNNNTNINKDEVAILNPCCNCCSQNLRNHQQHNTQPLVQLNGEAPPSKPLHPLPTPSLNNNNDNNRNNFKVKSTQDVIAELNQSLGEYAEDIHLYHKENEERYWLYRRPDPFSNQPEVTHQMRAVLVDWLIEVTQEYGLTGETLFLTVNYLDRSLEVLPVTRATLQLLGVACMLLACKFEEVHTPEVDDFVYITDRTYSRADILRMELLVLSSLNFCLTASTVKNFLRRFLIVAEVKDARLNFLSHYLSEMTLPVFSIHQKYKPSQIAAAITYIAKATGSSGGSVGTSTPTTPAALPPVWNPVLETYTSYSMVSLKSCIQEIFEVYLATTRAPVGNNTAAREKYRQPKYLCSSTITLNSEVLFLFK